MKTGMIATGAVIGVVSLGAAAVFGLRRNRRNKVGALPVTEPTIPSAVVAPEPLTSVADAIVESHERIIHNLGMGNPRPSTQTMDRIHAQALAHNAQLDRMVAATRKRWYNVSEGPMPEDLISSLHPDRDGVVDPASVPPKPERHQRPTTAARFREILEKHGISIDANDWAQITGDGYPESPPVRDRLFAGVDAGGRVFINIPICQKTRNHNDRIRKSRSAFIVFQRYALDPNTFAYDGSMEPMDVHALLGQKRNDLTKLDQLLSGEKLKFHGTRNSSGALIDDPEYWIEFRMHNPAG